MSIIQAIYAALAVALFGLAGSVTPDGGARGRNTATPAAEPVVIPDKQSALCDVLGPRIAAAVQLPATRLLHTRGTSDDSGYLFGEADCNRGLLACSRGLVHVNLQPRCAGKRTLTATELSRAAAVLTGGEPKGLAPFMAACLAALKGTGPTDLETRGATLICDNAPGLAPLIRVETADPG